MCVWGGRPNPLLVTESPAHPVLSFLHHLFPLLSLPHPFNRYLDPESADLLSELSKTTNKKYHKLNKAIAALVRGRSHLSNSLHRGINDPSDD